jgi:hypothetical protein
MKIDLTEKLGITFFSLCLSVKFQSLKHFIIIDNKLQQPFPRCF